MFNLKNSALFLAILLVSIAVFNYQFNFSEKSGDVSGDNLIPAIVEKGENKRNCIKEEKVVEAQGTSLLPIISAGEKFLLLVDYYSCYKPQRGDLVAYNYAGSLNPIAKIIKAVPGDRWELLEEGGGAAILVNGEILKNSGGERYFFPSERTGMLRLYAKDYPVIPANTYLILGDNPSGTLDATRFGLVAGKDIIGKLEIKR